MAHDQANAEVRDDGGAPALAHTLRADGFDTSEDGTGRGTPIVPVAYDMTHGDDPMRPCGDIAPNLQQRMGTGGNQVPVVAFQQNASGEVRDGKVAYTLNQNSNASGRNTWMVHTPLAVRRLTPRECERLQGFPDDWTRWGADGREISDSARYRMLGNAVTVNVARWIGARMAAHTPTMGTR
jgi:DNA (cytosine-5)-methyltransferase 1